MRYTDVIKPIIQKFRFTAHEIEINLNSKLEFLKSISEQVSFQNTQPEFYFKMIAFSQRFQPLTCGFLKFT